MAKSDSELSSIDSNAYGDETSENEDYGEEEIDEGLDEDEEEEEQEEEEEEDDDDDDDDDDVEEISDIQEDDNPEEIQVLSDDDDDANFKLEDIDDDADLNEREEQEEGEEQKPVKKRLNLKLKLSSNSIVTPSKRVTAPKVKAVEPHVTAKRPLEEDVVTPKPKRGRPRKVGRPKKSASYDYNEEDDDLLSDADDAIPTPAIDELSSDFDQEEEDYNVDISKMTERQKAKHLEATQPKKLISLSNGVKQRSVLSEEEHRLKKAEIARKRKNLTDKKLEEEKQDTINKLLKRRAGKASVATLKEDEESSKKEKARRPQIKHEALFTFVSKGESLLFRVPDPFFSNSQ